jgi:hypothetical protein
MKTILIALAFTAGILAPTLQASAYSNCRTTCRTDYFGNQTCNTTCY